MEKVIGAKTTTQKIEYFFCLAAEDLLHEKKEFIGKFIHYVLPNIY